MTFLTYFYRPGIIAIIGDVSSGKSMLLYNIIEEITKDHKPSIYAYGLRKQIKNVQSIYSVYELERVTDSVIIADEFSTLLNTDNRNIKRQIESTLRLIHHNNNVLVLSGTAENYKKFISAKIDVMMFKKTTKADLINGSKVKEAVKQYQGVEKGVTVLDVPIDKTLIFDGSFSWHNVTYMKHYDTKAQNKPILATKKK